MKHKTVFAVLFAVSAAGLAATPASAITMAECSAKYQAAKDKGTLGSLKWNEFRRTKCGVEDVAEPARDEPFVEEPEKATSRAPAGVTFPRAVAARYASESPGKGRLHTCVDAYRINKSKDTLGGLKWIEKGGGYYSLCNARLKSNAS